MFLAISEDYIRQKVGLKDRNSDEVQSLSLRGSHLEKITDIDGALKHYTRLQNLDLSHNSISRLEGLKSLKLLKKLNLYYNNVGSLEELLHLRHNSHLEELDLRLNPVAKNAPDYRLILIHLLPNLRRLDERAVRDSERKAALMLFSTSTAAGISLKPPPAETKSVKIESLRSQHVKSLAKPFSVLEYDDVGLMDVLRKADPHRQEKFYAETYDPADVRQMNLEGVGYSSDLRDLHKAKELVETQKMSKLKSRSVDHLNIDTGEDTFHTKYPNILALTDMSATSNTSRNKQRHHSSERYRSNGDPNLKFKDEIAAYTTYPAKGHYTPAKASQTNGHISEQHLHIPSSHQICSRLSPSLEEMASADIVTAISALVDRYWNGSRSLVSNQNFVGQLNRLLSDHNYSNKPVRSRNVDEHVQRLKSQVQKLEDKIITMHERHLENNSEKEVRDEMEKSSASRAMAELSITKTRLRQCLERNKILERQIENFTKSRTAQLSGDEILVENVMLENARLRQSIDHLQQQFLEKGNFQALALMLQQSHEWLAETNRHLSKEVKDLKKSRDGDYFTSIAFEAVPRTYES